jgi:hypothetical protein
MIRPNWYMRTRPRTAGRLLEAPSPSPLHVHHQRLVPSQRGQGAGRVHDQRHRAEAVPGEGIYAARADVEPPPGNPPLVKIKPMPVDYDYIEKESKALKNRFNETFQ